MQEDVSTVGPSLEDGSEPSSRRELTLVVMEQRSLTRYAIGAKPQLRIGRAEDCDILLKDPMASRYHAVLHVQPRLELEDLGSRNGSVVKNLRLAANGRSAVSVGETIQIGQALLVLQRAARPRSVSDAESADFPPEAAGVIVADAAMREVHELVRELGPGTLSVLITGETGVGKEVIAEAIHRASGARGSGPFVRINCAALTESLFESELFGHERGSFTGASRAKAGLLETAHGGTAFLDEVAELPLPAQAKLLRVLEARELFRVGSVKSQVIDVRFVAATNRDLRAEVARGAFREDLFFRLAGATIAIPPLRERPDELLALANAFVAAVSAQLERPTPSLSASALGRLRAHSWPGNIRELKNVIERAVLRAAGAGFIEVAHLPPELLTPGPRRLSPYPGSSAASPTLAAPRPLEPDALDEQQLLERERILNALSDCNGNQTRAAQKLSMPRRTLVAKLGVYGLPRPRKLTP